MDNFWQYSYLFAAVTIILSIKWLNSPATARRGVLAGEIGMLFAIAGTLVHFEVLTVWQIWVAFLIGTAIGVPIAFLMPMTSLPTLTALSHAFGTFAAALVGTAEYYRTTQPPTGFPMVALAVEVLLGFLTFTASIMAFGKLQEIVPRRPVTYKGQNFVNLALFAFAIALGVWMVVAPAPPWVYPTFCGLALLFGVLLIIPIGGGDMPTVIALLNSYAGMSAAAMGFALDNKMLIIAGALNAASGFILSVIMCNAMNPSFSNVLFGAFGQVQTTTAAQAHHRPVHSATPVDAAEILSSARKVIIVPGYGMARAQGPPKIRQPSGPRTQPGRGVPIAPHPRCRRHPRPPHLLVGRAS